MAVRKSVEEVIVVDGQRDVWIGRCEAALRAAGFGGIEANITLNQVKGTFHKLAVWGDILITLLPEGTHTKIVAKATANVDNIWALFSSPTKKILEAFKSNLS